MVKQHLDVLEFASHANQNPDLKTLTAEFAGLVDRFGFTSFIFTGLPISGDDIAPLVICDHWPAGWTERYAAKNYFAEDPVGRWSLSKRRPFRWREAQDVETSTKLRRQIADEAWDYGLADGIAYPLRGETDAVVSLASDANLSIDPMDEASLFLAVSYFKTAAEDLDRPKRSRQKPTFTNREIEHLKWMAAGKTVWETSCILSLSASAVKLHRSSIRTKLGAATTTQAVAVAIKLGVIPL